VQTYFTGIDRKAYPAELKARRALSQAPRSVAEALAVKRGDTLRTPAASKLAAFLSLLAASGRA